MSPAPCVPPRWLSELPVTLVEATFSPAEPWQIGGRPGVAVRGAIGRAVMELACVRDHAVCVGCDRLAGCLVPGWFDPGRAGGHAPRPLALVGVSPLDAPVSGLCPLVARWVMVGVAPRPSLLVEALARMGGVGLGPERVAHRVERLVVEGAGGPAVVLEGERQAAAWPAPSSLAAFAELPVGAAEAALAVASPIQWRGASPGCPPRVSDLVRLAVDRARSVARAVGVRVDRWWPSPDAVAGEWSDPVWVAGSRWSQRQGARVDLSGWTGTLRLDPTGVEDLLAAAVVLGVGRGTSAGMGRLRWV